MKKSDQMFHLHLRKCEYCGGQDGQKKDVYETFQSALDTAKYIEENRQIRLTVYQCPHGNGWHLTKSDASQEILFQNNDIPLKSSDGSWEYIQDTPDEIEKDRKTNIIKNKNTKKDAPIKKMECRPDVAIKELSGKIMEFVKNVDIEKTFKINLDNPFCANMTKNILDGTVNQITIYVENNNQFESYTILIKDRLLPSNKIIKGKGIKLNIVGKSINNIKMWCCNKVI